MKVRDLITELMKYDVNAEFIVTINELPTTIVGFGFGSSRGDQPDKADTVTLGIIRDDLYQIKSTIPPEDYDQISESTQKSTEENPKAAHVGSNTSQGKGNWFAGTSWGS